MTDLLDAVFSQDPNPSMNSGADSKEESDATDKYDPHRDPHISIKTTGKREDKKIRREEFKSLSNKHKHARTPNHGVDPFKRVLWTKVEKAFNRLRSQDTTTRREKEAPFRVVIVRPNGDTDVSYWWHGHDIIEVVLDNLMVIARSGAIVVQKRIKSRQKWHQKHPARCVAVDLKKPAFGLLRMMQTYNWKVEKTRLQEVELILGSVLDRDNDEFLEWMGSQV